MNTLWVALGGAIGSVARFHLADLATRRAGPDAALPWGTLAVNVIGSLLISVVMVAALRTGGLPAAARLALVTGVLGGFTTYSAFNFETMRLVQTGAWGRAAAYVGLTVFGCMVAGLAGWAAARLAFGSP